MIARKLGVELGEYYHYVGSVHVYKNDVAKMAAYIDEGYQKLAEMPPMPLCDPFNQVPLLLESEHRMRGGEYFDASSVVLDPYWVDLIRLLQAFWASAETRGWTS
jgi:thymidylate synthase